jgi:hypothetical protein
MSVALAVSACSADDEKNPDPPSASPTAEAWPTDNEFETEFRKIVARVPGWYITNVQEMFLNAPCAGNWSSEAEGA